MTSQLQSFAMARYPLTGSRVSLSASTRVRGVHWKGDGLIRQLVSVWLRSRQRHNRRNLFCQAAARQVSSCQQETLHGFRRPGEDVSLCALEGHLVSAEKTSRGGVDGATGAGDTNAWSRVHVGEGYSEEFEMKVGVHLGSILSPLLYIIVSEALSHEFRSGAPGRTSMPITVNLVLIAELLEECVRRLLTWKKAMEEKGLRVNAEKTKSMISGMDLDLLQNSDKFPCAFCRTGVGSNSIICIRCKHWVHKKCSGLKRMTKDPDYRCSQCQGTACPLESTPQREVRQT